MNEIVTEYLSTGIRLICDLKELKEINLRALRDSILTTKRQKKEIKFRLNQTTKNISELSHRIDILENNEKNTLNNAFKKFGLDTVEKRMCFYVLAHNMENFMFNMNRSCFVDINNDELKTIISIVTEDGTADSFDSLVKYAFSQRLNEIKLLEVDDSAHRFGGNPTVFNKSIRPSALLSEAAFGSILDQKVERQDHPAEKNALSILTSPSYVSTFSPAIALDDVILAEEQKRKILDFLWFYSNRSATNWDLAKLGISGNSAIFYGPPGTGKTMLAEAIAGELKKDIARVKYENIIDCWVGESEKNIQKVFSQNRERGNILLFDECDALLESRSDAAKSVDKMNNRMINIILQELEKYPGILIFTTNRAVSLDPALERRIMLKMELGRPVKEARLRIWQKMTEGKIPLENTIDWEELAELDLSGGEIKNAIINLAKDPGINRLDYKVNTKDLLKAAQSEASSAFKDKKKNYGFKV